MKTNIIMPVEKKTSAICWSVYPSNERLKNSPGIIASKPAASKPSHLLPSDLPMINAVRIVNTARAGGI